MADQAGDVVIRGEDGHDHVFPPGFDPKRAASIVRMQSGKVQPGPNVFAQMGPRPSGGYNISDAPEGAVSQTIRGMVEPSPEMQAAMDVLPLVPAAVAAGARVLPSAQTVRSGLRVVGQGLQNYDVTRPAKPIGEALDYLGRQRPVAGVEPMMPNTPGYVPGAPAAPQGPMPTTAVIDRYAPNTGGVAPASPPGGGAGAAAGPPMPPSMPSEARYAELMQKFGGTAPETPTVSPAAVQKSIGSQLGKLNAEEVSLGMQWQKAGISDPEIVKRLETLRALKGSSAFAKLPSAADVKADFQQQAVSGKKSLMPRYGPPLEESDDLGNPYRR
jgi:hypothetical protein